MTGKIREAQLKASTAANKELVRLYWAIGETIHNKQQESNWGEGFIETLARDLQNAFPCSKGFSARNILRMRAFYRAYANSATAVAEIKNLPFFSIPWGHNAILIGKVKDNKTRLWYAQKTLEEGWSRQELERQIKLQLSERSGAAITNFSLRLPKPQSHLAQESLKDPYLFDFLSLSDKYNEKEVEQGLVDHIQKFLIELGKGFAFVGRQKHLKVGNADYYVDLLFYHLKLRCYVVVELKSIAFKPEFAGKLNFYLSAVDDLLRHPEDRPTIGLLLCKSKDDFAAEYALRGMTQPIGVCSYETEITKSLPKDLKGSLPTIEEIEAELEQKEKMKSKKP